MCSLQRLCALGRKWAWALGEIGSPAVPASIRALEDEDIAVRANAAWTLGKIGEAHPEDNWADAVIALARVVRDKDESGDVKERAIMSLGKMRIPNAARVLISELSRDNVHPMEVARALRRTYPSDVSFLKMLVVSVRRMKEKNPQKIDGGRLDQIAMEMAHIHKSWGQWLSESAKKATYQSKIPMALRKPKSIKPEEISRIRRINQAKRAI